MGSTQKGSAVKRATLTATIRTRTGLSADVVDQVLDSFAETLLATARAGQTLNWPGLFTLDIVHRSARAGRNPHTGEPMQIPARFGARLRPGSRLSAAARRAEQ